MMCKKMCGRIHTYIHIYSNMTIDFRPSLSTLCTNEKGGGVCASMIECVQILGNTTMRIDEQIFQNAQIVYPSGPFVNLHILSSFSQLGQLFNGENYSKKWLLWDNNPECNPSGLQQIGYDQLPLRDGLQLVLMDVNWTREGNCEQRVCSRMSTALRELDSLLKRPLFLFPIGGNGSCNLHVQHVVQLL
jgi:hypothetical protein